jgi:ABC-2 type transport system ATP-binding protein
MIPARVPAPDIVVAKLRKEYRVAKREPGFAAAFRALFSRRYETVVAVDGIDFEIAPASAWASSAPTARARPPRSRCSRACSTRRRARAPCRASPARAAHGLPPSRSRSSWAEAAAPVGPAAAAETFELNRAIYEVPTRAYFEARVERARRAARPRRPASTEAHARQLSLGERMKCELAAALLHGPRCSSSTSRRSAST